MRCVELPAALALRTAERLHRVGLLPTPAAIGSALGDDSGYSSAYSAGPWPADLG